MNHNGNNEKDYNIESIDLSVVRSKTFDSNIEDKQKITPIKANQFSVTNHYTDVKDFKDYYENKSANRKSQQLTSLLQGKSKSRLDSLSKVKKLPDITKSKSISPTKRNNQKKNIGEWQSNSNKSQTIEHQLSDKQKGLCTLSRNGYEKVVYDCHCYIKTFITPKSSIITDMPIYKKLDEEHTEIF